MYLLNEMRSHVVLAYSTFPLSYEETFLAPLHITYLNP